MKTKKMLDVLTNMAGSVSIKKVPVCAEHYVVTSYDENGLARFVGQGESLAVALDDLLSEEQMETRLF